VLLATLCACATNTLTSRPMGNAIDTTMGEATKRMDDNLILVTMHNDVHRGLIQGENIQATDRQPPRYAAFMASVSRKYGIRRVADWPLAALDVRCLVFSSDAGQRDTIVAALQNEPGVETVQALRYFRTLREPSGIYDDPLTEMQHSLTEMQIWRSHQFATGSGVTVAVIDTGLDTRHPEFDNRVLGVRNFVDRKSMENDIHGTAVAGVIAANANNGEGMVGVAPDAQLIGLKACWPEAESSDHAYCSSFTLAKAINFAILQRVNVINLSLSGPADPLLARLLRTAQSHDIIVVGAVDGQHSDRFPANVPGVVGVTIGKDSTADNGFVSAPGVRILSTLPNQDYDFYSGSSLAAGHVSGIAALIRQRKPHLPAEVVVELLKKTVDPDSGAVNACRALAAIVTGLDCESPSRSAQTRDVRQYLKSSEIDHLVVSTAKLSAR